MWRLLGHRVHDALVRWLYRALAPRHPRGWLDVHAVWEDDQNPATLWVHCHGMERWGLMNLEIVGVPADLAGYAHGILFELTGYMKQLKPIRADESFGGFFCRDDQRAVHQGTMRLSVRDEEPTAKEFLRVVDLGLPLESGFPRRLFAAHLIALADAMRHPQKRRAMYRRAIEIFPGHEADPMPEGAEFHPAYNYNNFLAWEGLGDALFDLGEMEEGERCLREAIARCPRWAAEFQQHVRQQVREHPELAQADPRFGFWAEARINGASAAPREGSSGGDG